jgi:hypothetical protein
MARSGYYACGQTLVMSKILIGDGADETSLGCMTCTETVQDGKSPEEIADLRSRTCKSGFVAVRGTASPFVRHLMAWSLR